MTAGIVSSLDRTIRVQDPQCTVCSNGVRTYSEVIQTDAAINHGNSGGPLVDMEGRVVGINSAGSDERREHRLRDRDRLAKAAVEQAISDPLQATAYLGVSTRSVTADLAFQLGLPVEQGALVLATLTGGPAADAGIREGDVIVEMDGKSIDAAKDLGRVLDALKPGDEVDVRVIGAGGEERGVGHARDEAAADRVPRALGLAATSPRSQRLR